MDWPRRKQYRRGRKEKYEDSDISCSWETTGKGQGKNLSYKWNYQNGDSGTPVTLRIVARFLPPKSGSKVMKKRMLEGEVFPLKKPDMDNIVKVVSDALNGVAYHDDTQVVLVVAKKAYSAMEGLDITVEEYINGK